jgi:hypothetical protein
VASDEGLERPLIVAGGRLDKVDELLVRRSVERSDGCIPYRHATALEVTNKLKYIRGLM